MTTLLMHKKNNKGAFKRKKWESMSYLLAKIQIINTIIKKEETKYNPKHNNTINIK